MKRVAAFVLLALLGAVAWLKAGDMPIHYATDPDVQQTEYKRPCNAVVVKYLGKKEAGRLNAERYLDMLRELRACGERVDTPDAKPE